jgi:cytoskeletal protein CcmA (bactofilin family)
MTEIEILPQRMVDAKTFFLKFRVDPNKARKLGEESKRSFFAKLGIIKPKPEEIKLVAFDKYYEPYTLIGGKYAIDYCKRHIYTIQVGEELKEVFIGGKKFQPESFDSEKPTRVLKLKGEECSHYEEETYFILNRTGRELPPEKLPFAPFQDQLGNSADGDFILKRMKVTPEKELEFLRSRIALRPLDVAEIIREIFEVTERATVYRPTYQLTYQNVKTGREVLATIDGITGEVTLSRYDKKVSGKLVENFVETCPEYPSPVKTRSVQDESESPAVSTLSDSTTVAMDSPERADDKPQAPVSAVSEGEEALDFPGKVTGPIFHVGDNVTAIVGDLEIPFGTPVSETLVVKGTLKICDECKLSGNLKVLKDITVGTNVEIVGNVISGGNVVVGAGSIIHGSIESAGEIEIAPTAIVEGKLRSKSSVAASLGYVQMMTNTDKDTSAMAREDESSLL